MMIVDEDIKLMETFIILGEGVLKDKMGENLEVQRMDSLSVEASG